MRLKYKCPECPQEFSRRWNMRHHCESQHGYDPEKSGFPELENEELARLKEITSIRRVNKENLMKCLNYAETSLINGKYPAALRYIQSCQKIISHTNRL